MTQQAVELLTYVRQIVLALVVVVSSTETFRLVTDARLRLRVSSWGPGFGTLQIVKQEDYSRDSRTV